MHSRVIKLSEFSDVLDPENRINEADLYDHLDWIEADYVSDMDKSQQEQDEEIFSRLERLLEGMFTIDREKRTITRLVDADLSRVKTWWGSIQTRVRNINPEMAITDWHMELTKIKLEIKNFSNFDKRFYVDGMIYLPTGLLSSKNLLSAFKTLYGEPSGISAERWTIIFRTIMTMKTASYDVTFEPKVNVRVKVDDPKKPTSEEIENIIRRANCALYETFDDCVCHDSISAIELYSTGSHKEQILGIPETVADWTNIYVPHYGSGDKITETRLRKDGWKWSRYYNCYTIDRTVGNRQYKLRLCRRPDIWKLSVREETQDEQQLETGSLIVNNFSEIDKFLELITLINK